MTESGLVPILQIQVSGLNDEIYHPINPDDPAIRDLAESIRQNGVLEPLVLSEDWFILSGHRRHAAGILAGLTVLPCRVVKGVFRSDPDFLAILREFNRQRVKGVDEVYREALVDTSADDLESAERILMDRERRSETKSQPLELEARKARAKISSAKGPLLAAILGIIEDQRSFWPLTVRQIHYLLLNDPPLLHASKPGRYQNTPACYKNQLIDLTSRARLEGDIPWESIYDPTRPITITKTHPNVEPFIKEQQADFLKGYWRDYQQSQPHHFEIVGEKSTLANIIQPVAMDFCIPLTIGRGHSSIKPREEMFNRYRASGKRKLVVLILSDFDPAGETIAESFARSMRDDFGVEDMLPVKVALRKDQVDSLGLIPSEKAKAGSSTFEKFVAKYGPDVFELEAVPPARLQAMLRDEIMKNMDLDALDQEKAQELVEQATLQALKRKLGAA
jgi:hypothetical protein